MLSLCLKLGKLSPIWAITMSQKILMLRLKNPLPIIQKDFESVVVILLEKGLFKSSLLVPVLYLLSVFSILHRTSCLADAIAMLLVELERQFMHMHPCIQRIFLEFSNIEHSSVKRAVTIFLAHEFRFIIREAKEIFVHYRVDVGRPQIEAILFNQEEIRRFQSLDYVAFNENLRKKVPTNVLIDRISELNNEFALRNNELGYSLEYRLTRFCQKNAFSDELVVHYEGPKEEPVLPEIDLGDFCPAKFSSFDYFCFLRKLVAEHREYEMSFQDLSYYYGTT